MLVLLFAGLRLSYAETPAEELVNDRAPAGSTLAVTVTDDYGIAVPGALVTVSSDDLLGGPQQRETNEDGEANFTGLPAGRYTVMSEMLGFAPTKRRVVIVDERTGRVAVALWAEDTIVGGRPLPFAQADAGRGTWIPREALDRLPELSLGGPASISRHPGLGAGLEGGEQAALRGVPVNLDAVPLVAGSIQPGGVRVWSEDWQLGAEPGVDVWVDRGGGSDEASLRTAWVAGAADMAASVAGPLARDNAWFSGIAESLGGEARTAAGGYASPNPWLTLGAQTFLSSAATDSRVDATVFPNPDLVVRATSAYATCSGGPGPAIWLGDLQATAFPLDTHRLDLELLGVESLMAPKPRWRISASAADTWRPSARLVIAPRIAWQWRSGEEVGDPTGRLGLWVGPENGGGFAVVARRLEGWNDPDAAIVRRDEVLLGGGFGSFIRVKATAYGALRVDEDGGHAPGRADLQLAATCPMGAEPFPGTGLTGSAAATWRPAIPGFNDDLPSAEAGVLVTDSWITTASGRFPARLVPAVGVGTGAAIVDGVVRGQFAARVGVGLEVHRTLLEFGVEAAIGTPAWLTAGDVEEGAWDLDPAALTPVRFSLRLRR